MDVTHNQAAHQFEVSVDGDTAALVYRRSPGVLTIVHTGVPDALAGRGIAGQLAVASLTYAREQQLAVVPLCPFVAEYIRKHQEYLDLVHEAYRERLTRAD